MFTPGDIIVIPVPSGFMIGRILDRPGPGPWWEQVRTETDFFEALDLAQEIARQEGKHTWIYESAKDVREVSIRPSK